MGKATGFMEYTRQTQSALPPKERIKHYNEFHPPLEMEERRLQGARCMDCGVPFCQSCVKLNGTYSGCPLHNLIPEWNDLIWMGAWKAALQRLLKTSSFPEFTGRVCPALCEAACTCGGLGETAVTVRENELALVEHGFAEGWIKPNPPKVRSGKTVAVIGSGPAGLAAADLLNRRGHSVTVLEKADRLGGLLMYGIPNMKLEKRVVERRTALMAAEGVRFETGVWVGKDVSAEELRAQYDAVVICAGAERPRDLAVPGREAEGVHFAVEYLSDCTKALLDGKEPAVSAAGKHVVVVGGGDTGNDCCGTAMRQGCKSLVQLEMMPKLPETRSEDNPWPQWPRVNKTDYGQEEATAVFGVDPRLYQTTVTGMLADEAGKLKEIEIVSLAPAVDAATGRQIMQPVAGTEKRIPCDLLLIACGFLGPDTALAESFELDTDARGNLLTQEGAYTTSQPGIFAAGDCRRGQSLVVWAITEGRSAAAAVDEYLMGYTCLE